MTTAGWQHNPRTHPTPLVETVFERHNATRDAPVTVTQSPLLASYLVGTQPEVSVRRVRHEQGAVVVEAESEAFGTLLSVLQGGSTVEVALHANEGQLEAYRATVAAVDVEQRELMLGSVREAAVGILRELGVELGEQPLIQSEEFEEADDAQ